ncbi:LOW QUALITY PROTEIN: free fatty acid receptor 4-like [Xenentodon cancila]
MQKKVITLMMKSPLKDEIKELQFSFFSELHYSGLTTATIVETLVITWVFLVSVAANAGAAVWVTCERMLLANKSILTLKLFVADVLFVRMIPLIVAVRWTVSWRLGYTACHTVLVTITSLAPISMERIQFIFLQTVSTLRIEMVTASLIFIWAFSPITSIPLSLFFTVMDCPKQIAKHCRQRLQPRDIQPSAGDPPNYQVSRQDAKLFCAMLVLVLSFLMWSRIFIIIFFILIQNFLAHRYVPSKMLFWVVTFTPANSALNPILYSICQSKSNWQKLCFSSVVVPQRNGHHASCHKPEIDPLS